MGKKTMETRRDLTTRSAALSREKDWTRPEEVPVLACHQPAPDPEQVTWFL